MLITASSAIAAPQGTVIKEGVLTYPAGPYISKDPLLLSLENYTGINDTQTLAESFEIINPENEYPFFENNSYNITLGNLSACDPRICPPNPFYDHYEYKEMLHPGFAFICYFTYPYINRTLPSTPFNASFRAV